MKKIIAELRSRRNRLLREGKWEEALAVNNDMISIAPTASRYTRRGMILIKLRRHQEALTNIEKALQLDPQDRHAKRVLGKLLAHTEAGHSRPVETMQAAEPPASPIIYDRTQAFLAGEVEKIITARKKTAPEVRGMTVAGLTQAKTILDDTATAGGGKTHTHTHPHTTTQEPSQPQRLLDEPEVQEIAVNAGQSRQDTNAADPQTEALPKTKMDEFVSAKTEFVAAGTPLSSPDDRLDAPSSGSGQPSLDHKALAAGTRLGEYVVQEKIGQGGMGTVYKAVHTQLHQIVAIKILAVEDVSVERIQRFNQEAQLAAKLQHPNIVPIFNFGLEKNFYYLVMQWIDGVPLNTLLTDKQLSPRQALDIMQQIGQAIAYAHAAGVIHRDLKPSNIMIDRWGRALVLDFGLAKSTQMAPEITRPGQILGTPKYMSPEQAAGQMSQVDAQTDVYSMGIMLYEMLTGKCPFEAESMHNIIYQILHQEPVPARKLNPRLHKDLQTLVAKAMAKEKPQRYATARALQEDIERYLHGETILATPPRLPAQIYKWGKRHLAVTGMVAVSLLFVTLLTGWYHFWYDSHEKLKTMYQEATTEDQKNVILATLGTHIETKDGAFLRRILELENSHQQAMALRILANMGAAITRTQMESFLTSQDDELVQAAIYATGKFQWHDMIPRLKSFFKNPHYDWRTHMVALEALSELQLADAIPLCIEALGDKCAMRDTAKKILLHFREQAISPLVDVFLGDHNGNILVETAQVLLLIGSPVLPQIIERMPRSNLEQQIRILKMAGAIADASAIEFLIHNLTNPSMERKALTLLRDINKKFPNNQRVTQIIAQHHPKFFLLVEAQCYGVVQDRLRHNIQIIPPAGYRFQDARLQIKLPANFILQKETSHAGYRELGNIWEWSLPSLVDSKTAELAIYLAAVKVGHGLCEITLFDGLQQLDHMEYYVEVVGVAGVHCSSYDTEDPIPVGDKTTYVVEIRNEGHAPISNLRFVSRVTPELEIEEIRIPDNQDAAVPARVSLIGKDKGLVFLEDTLDPGVVFRYHVICRAAKIGSALHTVALTYDQFTREINLSEGTMVYWR